MRTLISTSIAALAATTTLGACSLTTDTGSAAAPSSGSSVSLATVLADGTDNTVTDAASYADIPALHR